jgi:hypothetical protein
MRQSTRTMIRRLAQSQVTRAGFVYFMQAPSGAVKIGWSSNPSARREALQRELGISIRLLSTRPGSMLDERRLHARFAHLRLWPDREWFRAAPELLAVARPLPMPGRRRQRTAPVFPPLQLS